MAAVNPLDWHVTISSGGVAYALRYHEWLKRATADERRGWYYDWLLTSSEAAAEIRLFDLGEYLQWAYQHLRRRRRRREQLRLAREQEPRRVRSGCLGLADGECRYGLDGLANVSGESDSRRPGALLSGV